MAYMSKEGYDKLRAEIKQLEEVDNYSKVNLKFKNQIVCTKK